MNNIKLFIGLVLITTTCSIFSQKKSNTFEFIYKGNKLNGLIEYSNGKEPASLVIIVPGSGRTNFVEGNWYGEIRSYFIEQGIACCVWDKTGCGKSEGTFDPGMEGSVENNADEILAAIKELRRSKAPGSEKIGLWGHSRAGWICPYVLMKDTTVAFWVSVSSPDNKDQSVYFLKHRLIHNGRTEDKAQILVSEYWKGESIFFCGGSYEEYLEATKEMRKDSICIEHCGKTKREDYNFYQKKFLSNNYQINCETGEVFSMPGFEEAVSSIQCPTLAIFGEKDSQVDWRHTVKFYETTIKNAELTIKTLPDCNHAIQKCKIGAWGEDLSEFNWIVCDDYFETMTDWLEKYGIIN